MRIAGTVEALGIVVTLACVSAALKYGLTIDGMAPVFSRASGWSGSLRRILPALATGGTMEGLDLPRLVGTLRSADESRICTGGG
jgi:hypothetical protein